MNRKLTLSPLLDNPVHASILWKLRTGRAYTAIELAKEAHVSKDEIHSHLTELIQTNLLTEIERRKRGYYRLLNDEIIETVREHYLESGMAERDLQEDHHPKGMKYCRTCYNHLAGKVGVVLTDQLRHRRFIEIGDDTHFELTPNGNKFFTSFGIDTGALSKKRSQFAKACIDFSERKYHLGGSLGKALFDKMEEKDWIRRVEGAREIRITPDGKKAFAVHFGINI